MIGQKIFLEDFDFVVNEIRFGEVRTLLEHDDAKAVAGKFLGQDAAGGARTDDDEIDFVGRLVLGLLGAS